MNKSYVKVYILDLPYHLDNLYDYFVPDSIKETIVPGTFVTVPFGGANRRYHALVAAVSDTCEYEKVKPVLAVAHDRISLCEELLGLCLFMKEQTLCTIGEAVHAMVPAAAFSKLVESYSPVQTPAASGKNIATKALFICDFIRSNGKTQLSRLKSEFGDNVTESLSLLCREGLIVRDVEIKEPTNNKYIRKYKLAVPEYEAYNILSGEYPEKKLRSQKQCAVLDALLQNGELDETTLTEVSGAGKAVLKGLVEKGLISLSLEDEYRDPYKNRETGNYGENVLSDAQKAEFEKLAALYRTHEPHAALLYGVTGSGKTRVIKAMIDEVISDGRGVIMLLPEISLTPQTLDIFLSYYGERVAVIHSSLSQGERFDAWKRIKSGEADIVIGTRSAVFAPVKDLGMIVLDEEQEHTYKSDQDPKYHAKDIARWRCNHHGALMLLASATPSLDSFHKAKTGKYTLCTLPSRYGNAELPDVKIVDMRIEAQGGNTDPLSSPLLYKLCEITKKDEQAILFINRRGYNSFASCKSCGEVIKCPNCSVALRHHTYGRAVGGYLVCHYCGHRTDVPEKCPECSSEHMSFTGYGTQRIEEELATLVPGAKILRMDTDTTAAKFSYERLLGDFRQKQANILLGTQMVTKGHDFPDVTLVGVLLADAALYLDDFRAAERAFAMITQVIGRAGRSNKRGVALIQTCNPDSETIRLACAQDYETFYEREIKMRRLLVFPPFCDIVLLTLTGEYEPELFTAAKILREKLDSLSKKDFPDVKYVAFGPFEAPIYKLNGKFRMRMVLKCKLTKSTRALFSALLSDFGKRASRKLSLGIDFNPSSL